MLPAKYSFLVVSHRDVEPATFSPSLSIATTANVSQSSSSSVDGDRRLFLKILGGAGLGLFASSLFPSKASALVMGGTPSTSVMGVKNATNQKINPATEETLGTIATNTGTIATNTGNIDSKLGTNNTNTGTIATNTGNIDTKLAQFKFDGDNLLISGGAGGGGYEVVGIKDASADRVNPASDEAIVYLRRMVKLMESQATTDAANRQRIAVDSLGALGATMPVSGTVTANIVGSMDQRQFIDIARNAYATGIRQNLTWA